ncbi:MAG: hypothetical protein AAFY76_23835, partial [Cyanobacteria bacterium J06649_11]
NFKKLRIDKGGEINSKEEFSQMAQEYLSVNQFETCFPPEHIIENQHVKNVINRFFYKQKIKDNKDSKKALIGYSYIEHLKAQGYTDKDLMSFSTSGDHNNAILFLDEDRSLLVYIRVCKENTSCEDIKQEVKRCGEFINAFLLMYEKTFSTGALSICSFVALPGIPSKDVEEKTIFVNQEQEVEIFLSQECLDNDDNFKEAINKSHNFAKAQQKHSRTKTQKNQLLKQVFAECMVSMTLIKNSIYPRLSSDEHTQVLSLLLTKEQYEVIRNPNKKRIIRGPFGSGKSLVLEKIIKQLINLMEKEATSGTYHFF